MKKTLLLYLSLVLASLAGAQNHQNDDEAIVRKIADYILQQASFRFEGIDDHQSYASAKAIPENTKVRISDSFGEWRYPNGVLNMAMINLGTFLQEEKYLHYAIRHIAFCFDNYKYFEQHYQPGASSRNYPFWQLFNMHELDDCGAMGASVIEVYQKTKRPEYKEYIEKAARHITEIQDRLADQTLVRKAPYKMTLWADDLYMSVPLLSRMGTLSGNRKYFDDAIHQVLRFTHYLWDEKKDLYYHCYYSDLNRNGVAHWGRANGWVMMAQVHLLNQLPSDYPQRQAIVNNLDRQIRGLAQYQGPNGLWHQLLDKNDSYLESSCSAMFVYGIARAINQGWIDQRYASIALRGWEALKKNQITPDGQLKDVCVGTGIENDLLFYYHRPAVLNDLHGLGAVIDAGIEIIKLKNALNKK